MSDHEYLHPDAIVSGEWLEANLEDSALRIFDTTFYLHYGEGADDDPYRVESGRADYEKEHIPGAGFLDLQRDFSVADSPFRFTLMSPEETGAAFARAGVDNNTRVILYARDSMQRATRFWWMLHWLGFENAAVLDGGLNKWRLEGRPVSDRPSLYEPGTLTIRPRPGLWAKRDEVLAAIADTGVCTINALDPEFHSGENPGYGRPGRIAGSVNVPAHGLINGETKAFLPAAEAAQLLSNAGAGKEKRMITYCGGGIAATLDAFLLFQLGYENVAVYDDSMSEWAKDPALPMETG